MSDQALRYLFETSAAGSMRAASDKLNVAVSSISRQIAQLEAEYGLPLIERGRRTIKLTEAGRLAVDYFRDQQADREAFLLQLRDLRGIRSGKIDLAIGEGFLGNAFTALVTEFRKRNPQIKIGVITASTAEIVRSVLDDEAHFGLVFQLPSEPKIMLRSSAAQPLMAIMSPSHALAGRPNLTLRELAEQELCLLPKEFRIRQILSVAEAREHVFLEPSIVTNSIFIMRESARAGGTITILPQIAVWAELNEGSLICVPLADESIESTAIGLISRRGRQLEGAPMRLLSAM